MSEELLTLRGLRKDHHVSQVANLAVLSLIKLKKLFGPVTVTETNLDASSCLYSYQLLLHNLSLFYSDPSAFPYWYSGFAPSHDGIILMLQTHPLPCWPRELLLTKILSKRWPLSFQPHSRSLSFFRTSSQSCAWTLFCGAVARQHRQRELWIVVFWGDAVILSSIQRLLGFCLSVANASWHRVKYLRALTSYY